MSTTVHSMMTQIMTNILQTNTNTPNDQTSHDRRHPSRAEEKEMLSRTVGTTMAVSGWNKPGEVRYQYNCEIVKVTDKYVHVIYEDDQRRVVQHEIGFPGYGVLVLSPPPDMICKLKYTCTSYLYSRCYYGKAFPSGAIYNLEEQWVHKHFERDFVLRLHYGTAPLDGDGFATVGVGAPRDRERPLCVLGGLKMALDYTGRTDAAAAVETFYDASVMSKKRLEHAAGIASQFKHTVVKVTNVDPFAFNATFPTVLQVSAQHAITILGERIFDYNESKSLPLTVKNLSRCIGRKYDGALYRGYTFVPSKKRTHATDTHTAKRVKM